MRMNVQKSNSASVQNALRSYENGTSALLLITSDDEEISNALDRVFEIHKAPRLSPELELPEAAEGVGDCAISPEGVVLTVEGSGDHFMGLRFEVFWGVTDKQWREVAESNGCVWLALTPFEDYRSLGGDPFALIPAVPLLKLEVTA
ncbi:hypothetical protein SEA_SATIS_164 [Streptomyces phage Satis]|nr:hypothetical protein SEA_SATIS_164 [Streptomyces phage Satis]